MSLASDLIMQQLTGKAAAAVSGLVAPPAAPRAVASLPTSAPAPMHVDAPTLSVKVEDLAHVTPAHLPDSLQRCNEKFAAARSPLTQCAVAVRCLDLFRDRKKRGLPTKYKRFSKELKVAIMRCSAEERKKELESLPIEQRGAVLVKRAARAATKRAKTKASRESQEIEHAWEKQKEMTPTQFRAWATEVRSLTQKGRATDVARKESLVPASQAYISNQAPDDGDCTAYHTLMLLTRAKTAGADKALAVVKQFHPQQFSVCKDSLKAWEKKLEKTSAAEVAERQKAADVRAGEKALHDAVADVKWLAGEVSNINKLKYLAPVAARLAAHAEANIPGAKEALAKVQARYEKLARVKHETAPAPEPEPAAEPVTEPAEVEPVAKKTKTGRGKVPRTALERVMLEHVGQMPEIARILGEAGLDVPARVVPPRAKEYAEPEPIARPAPRAVTTKESSVGGSCDRMRAEMLNRVAAQIDDLNTRRLAHLSNVESGAAKPAEVKAVSTISVKIGTLLDLQRKLEQVVC